MNKEEGKKPPKLLLDEHIWLYLAALLRAQGYEVTHVNEVDLMSTPDDKIMEYAVSKKMAVVTFDMKDYIPLTIQYVNDGKEHYGVVLSKELSHGELKRRVTKLLESVTAEELMNMVKYL
jgi:predicted nuclease of predicted toxin-antitoxin system